MGESNELSSVRVGLMPRILMLAPPPPLLPEQSCGPELLDTFTVQSQPRGLAVDPLRQRLYVANFGSNSVSVVDTRNDEVLQNIPDIEAANGVAYACK